MSNYNTSTSQVRAACEQLVQQKLNIALAGPAQLHDLLNQSQQLSAASLNTLLAPSSPLGQTLAILAPDLTRRAADLLTTRPDAVTEAAQLVNQAGESALATINTAIRDASSETLAAAGAALGYALTSTHVGSRTTGLELRRGHEVLLVRVLDGGVVQMDHAGLADNSCLTRQSDLVSECRRRGLELATTTSVPHNRPAGGIHIAEAARLDRSSLARGAVLAAEGGPAAPAPRRLLEPETVPSHSIARLIGGAR